jgi:F0F1-type ATP synthase assembly protein I
MSVEKPSPNQTDPANGSSENWQAQSAGALELPLILVIAMLVGGGGGYLLDRWLHTFPWLMIVLGFVGFGTGVRDVIRRVLKSGGGGDKRSKS